jgi:hypothetical protein
MGRSRRRGAVPGVISCVAIVGKWRDTVSAQLARALSSALASGRLESLPPATLELALAMRRMSGAELLALSVRRDDVLDRERCPNGTYVLVHAAWREWLGGAC